jgi:nicotinate-nucleotide adenylyltransferase
MQQKIGIYPGTFDPVHQGHIDFAVAASQVCRLDKVIFIPETNPRGKTSATAIGHRLAMLQAATADRPNLEVAHLQSQQFTVSETLPELQAMFPKAHLILLIGSDIALHSLSKWPGIAELLKTTSLAIGMRTTDDPKQMLEAMMAIERQINFPVEYACVMTPNADVASSALRSNHLDGLNLNPAVIEYAETHKLYR